MFKIKNPRFEKSILNLKERPENKLPEVAFVGRSNVGKSSLINCLVNIHNFARVSKKPGKTRTINYFNIDEKFYLVDLPGYGFAKISKSERQKWQKAIEPYIKENPHLKRLYVLIDAKVGPKESDQQLIHWLRYEGIPFEIVATKADQISRGKQKSQEKLIREKLALSNDTPVLFFSAKNRMGRQELIRSIQVALSE